MFNTYCQLLSGCSPFKPRQQGLVISSIANFEPFFFNQWSSLYANDKFQPISGKKKKEKKSGRCALIFFVEISITHLFQLSFLESMLPQN
jgi:hypothetical protein